MSDSDDFGKVVDSSLPLAMAPGFLKSAYDSLERIELLLDEGAADADSDEVDRHFARSGFLLIALAQIEDVLNEACDDLSLFLPTTLRLRDITGHSEFERCQKYVQKVIQSGVPADSAWSTLKDYRIARNAIAHRGRLVFSDGQVKKCRQVERLKGVGTAPPGVLVLERDFAAHLLSFGLNFLEDLHLVTKRLYDHANRGESA